MLVDRVSNLSPSQESVVLSSTLLFDTYSFAEVNMLVVKSLQCRRNHSIKHSEIWEIVSPIDRDVISSSIDLALSTSLIQNIVI